MQTRERAVSAKIVRERRIACRVYKATAKALPVYAGEYSVTPDFTAQTLPTRGKGMREDVTVAAITVSRTANASGGNTIYIGGQING